MSEFRDKVRTLGVISARTRDTVREGRRNERDGLDAGQRCKSIKDELGNLVTESSNRQDVTIVAPHLRARLGQEEVRNGTS